MSVSFAGEQTNLKVRTFQGSRSGPPHPPLPHPGDRNDSFRFKASSAAAARKKKETNHAMTQHETISIVRGGSLLAGRPGSVLCGNQQQICYKKSL
jgi:hypothetical protein